jgi:hypothetical protein
MRAKILCNPTDCDELDALIGKIFDIIRYEDMEDYRIYYLDTVQALPQFDPIGYSEACLELVYDEDESDDEADGGSELFGLVFDKGLSQDEQKKVLKMLQSNTEEDEEDMDDEDAEAKAGEDEREEAE